ncbi:hypothetical protein TNCV_2567801 [Trichonephila clavipes]|uniref:Uncharacterized protein n=1 Tax=Trichonephila clavipes TaxID=2585209 RepID=A0A8X6WKK0_TRICX|nr:hypothetical protein TNCV_2567801 [Trichonephila clavipes]
MLIPSPESVRWWGGGGRTTELSQVDAAGRQVSRRVVERNILRFCVQKTNSRPTLCTTAFAEGHILSLREKTLGGARSLPLPPTTRKEFLFRVPPCRKGTMHLQTSMSSPGFEPSPYGIAVRVANHYTSWATFFQSEGE